jgi:hypothetical protein
VFPEERGNAPGDQPGACYSRLNRHFFTESQHARIQSRTRNIISDLALCCEAQTAAVPHIVSTKSLNQGNVGIAIKMLDDLCVVFM